MSRLRVLVFMGGYSTEHDVSVTSGTGVIRAMDAEKYNIHPVLIQKDGTWIWSSRELSPYQKNNFSENYFYALEGPSACSEKNPPPRTKISAPQGSVNSPHSALASQIKAIGALSAAAARM